MMKTIAEKWKGRIEIDGQEYALDTLFAGNNAFDTITSIKLYPRQEKAVKTENTRSEEEENLSQEGNAWVQGNANVYGNAEVCGNANVWGNAEVWGNAKVWGNAWVCGDAKVFLSNHVITIGAIGSRNDFTTFYRGKGSQIMVRCGCFNDTIDKFLEKVKRTHGHNKYALVYQKAAELAKIQIDLE